MEETAKPFLSIQKELQSIIMLSKNHDLKNLEKSVLPLLRECRLNGKMDSKFSDRLESLENQVGFVVESLKSDENSRKFGRKTTAETSRLDSFCQDRKAAIEDTIVLKESGDECLTFSDVAGLETAKQALAEALVYPFTHPHWYTGDRKPWRSVLLYGPPGTGKSRLAQAVAGEVDAIFYAVSSSDLVSSWSGQSEKLVRELFLHARNQSSKRSVVFIDEIDSLCRRRHSSEEESSRRLKTELLVQIQEIQKSDSNTYLLCATNCPWDLDTAFLRRFQKRIFIGLPDKASRIQILQKRMLNSSLDPGIHWESIGEQSGGLSGNDLADLAQEILFLPVRELQKIERWKFTEDRKSVVPVQKDERSRNDYAVTPRSVTIPRPVNQSDFVSALSTTKRTVSDSLLKKYEEFTKNSGVVG